MLSCQEGSFQGQGSAGLCAGSVSSAAHVGFGNKVKKMDYFTVLLSTSRKWKAIFLSEKISVSMTIKGSAKADAMFLGSQFRPIILLAFFPTLRITFLIF